MTLYWSFLLMSLVLWYFTTGNDERLLTVSSYKLKIRTKNKIAVFLFFAVLIFFCGLRSGIADTGVYIHLFKNYPVGLENINWGEVKEDRWGFYLLSVLYKTYISTDYHGWLFIIAFVSGIAMWVGFKRYASDSGFSCFLFIATTMFTYLLNGIRQFICVSILFAFSHLMTERKFIRYLICVLLLATIHYSVLMMIPIYFVVLAKPWKKSTAFVIAGGIILAVGFDFFFPTIENLLSKTEYGHFSDLLKEDAGSNIFRLIIAAVPVVLSYICRKQIYETEDRIIPIAVNMSIINMSLYVVATFTSGMTVGRLTTYFDIYNIILIPWLINALPSIKDRRIIRLCAIGGYIVFFYIQMVITWGSLPYESDILNLFIYH